ncbi:MAG: sigma-70 family RNA polymerase sigma factor [Planctomycetes bacterium]|nr:sigma-70 family RNA polymerase sigma factor [Planctomycetota bacterium]
MAEADPRLRGWMAAARGGDASAFARVAAVAQDPLYRLALANGLGAVDAAEATQETLARAYEHRRRFRADGDAMPWLYGILMNVVREYRRRRRPRAIDLETLAGAPSEVEAGRERLEALSRALERLPDRQREAVACRYLRGLSVRQTAEAMGCAEGTVKAATSAGLARLRGLMQEHR